MAQDLCFIPLNEDSPPDFDRKLVTGMLSKGAVQPVTDFYCAYPDRSHGEAHSIGDDQTKTRIGLGFTHFGGRMMMERIFELADTLEVFLAWSYYHEDDPKACVTRAERLERLRPEARFLNVVVARDAGHLNYLVKGSTFEQNGW